MMTTRAKIFLVGDSENDLVLIDEVVAAY